MKKFKIRECSDLDYEGMVVDICYDDGRLITLSCDQGINKTKVNIFDGINEHPSWELDYFEFIEVLKKSFNILVEINQTKNTIREAD